jgi:hypothetical protein
LHKNIVEILMILVLGVSEWAIAEYFLPLFGKEGLGEILLIIDTFNRINVANRNSIREIRRAGPYGQAGVRFSPCDTLP